MVYPYGSDSGFTDLNFWQWPACLAMFGVGTTAARQGWLDRVPDRLYRDSRAVTTAAVAGSVVLLSVVGMLDRIDDTTGGWQWPAVGFTAVETVLAVLGPVWLLGVAVSFRLSWLLIGRVRGVARVL